MNLLVTIPAESRRMNVGKDVIRILGSPAYICILQRKAGRILNTDAAILEYYAELC